MHIWDMLLLAVGLSMDAFAVSICKGLSTKSGPVRTGLACGAWFGSFQALMPFLGWLITHFTLKYVGQFGSADKWIERVSAYIAFALLAFLGIKMLVETLKECKCTEVSAEEAVKNASLAPHIMVVFAIATSIDAMAAGVERAVEKEPRIALVLALIGIMTFLFCFFGAFIFRLIGTKIGDCGGKKWEMGAGIAGGSILILLGLKTLVLQIASYF